MNYIGHHEVARRIGPEPNASFMFGAVAADLLRMSGAKRFLEPTDIDVARGVYIHRITNKPAFDSQPAVKKLEGDIRVSMGAVFSNNLVARQCTRAVKDLMYDGYVMTIEGSVGTFNETLGEVVDGKVDLEGLTDDEDALLGVAQRLYGNGPPDYGDLDVVATRLHRIMLGRRTEFGEAEIPKIAEILAPHQETVFAIGEAAMNMTVLSVQSHDL